MNVLTIKVDEEIVNAFKHFEDWISIGHIAEALKLTYPTAEKICWTLTGKGIVLWKPGRRRQQLFTYNQGCWKKEKTDVFHELDRLLGRDYYITGETALFLHNLTDHAMYQRIIEIALPKSKYNEIAEKVAENLNMYATIMPSKIPKRCNKSNIIADALGIGDVIVLRKALHNPRWLKFYGDLNLPGVEIILEEIDLPDRMLFEYALKAIDLNLTDEAFSTLCREKPVLIYLKTYLEGDREIPDTILNALKAAERNVRGY